MESLVGRFVRLDPLVADDAPLIEAAVDGVDRSTFAWGPVPTTDPTVPGASSAAATVASRLAQAATGAWMPFVQRRLLDGAIVGMTNYLNVERWVAGGDPTSVEIGGTWLLPVAQRTPINTEAKLLLLRHAFDVWHVVRVQIKTDARNEKSRRAIERLGATFEGVLRNYQPGNGDVGTGAPRDTAFYSVIDREWPDMRARLEVTLSEEIVR
jgi:N-acetyltransferase